MMHSNHACYLYDGLLVLITGEKSCLDHFRIRFYNFWGEQIIFIKFPTSL